MAVREAVKHRLKTSQLLAKTTQPGLTSKVSFFKPHLPILDRTQACPICIYKVCTSYRIWETLNKDSIKLADWSEECVHGQDTTNRGGGPVRTCVGWRGPREPLPGSLTQKDAAARGRTRAGSGPARGDRDGLPNQEGSTARHKTNPEEVLPQADGFLAATEA